MKTYRTTPEGKLTDEILYIKDTPKIFQADSYLDLTLEKSGKGHFIMPSGMFGVPQAGDLIDMEMTTGNVLRCVVLNFTQDYDMAKGDVMALCYKQHYDEYIQKATVKSIGQLAPFKN